MPLLLYCVAREGAQDTKALGIHGASVLSRVHSGLTFFFSEIAGGMAGLPDVATAAQEVHRVVAEVFARGAALPFRYPTLVEGESELEMLAKERGEKFRGFLDRVGDRVQMDIRLSTNSAANSQESGREYLQGKAERRAQLAAVAEVCARRADAAEWKIEERGENLLCHALIERRLVVSFQERMRGLILPDKVKAVVSGPWPPAGFWED